jgi:glycerophosphoryl diester phosphodiesterase
MAFHVVRIAHRGASVEHPENTLLAYRKAIDYGIDALEADIHLTRDHELVAIHDGTLERTTNGTGRVREHTLSELEALDVGRGEKIPRLAQIFALAAHAPIRLYLEIKGDSEAEYLEVAEALLSAVEAAGLLRKVILTSYSSPALLRVKALQPGVSTMLDPSPQDGSLTPQEICEQVLRAGANSISYDFNILTPRIAEEARLNGLALYPWMPNDPEEIHRTLALGVTGVMTDRPDVLNQVLRAASL